jgi:hypothetical protein
MIAPAVIAGLLALGAASEARSVGRRQSPDQFNPSPSSGLDDPTIQIADAAFGTAIQAGYQGPMASYEDHALVGPVDLLRSGTLNDGVVSNYTMPLYAGISESGQGYWFILTDSSDEGMVTFPDQ